MLKKHEQDFNVFILLQKPPNSSFEIPKRSKTKKIKTHAIIINYKPKLEWSQSNY